MSRSLIITLVVLLVAVLALGGYVLHLKRSAEQPQHATDLRPVTPPVAGPPVQVALAIANDADGSVSAIPVALPLPQDASKRPKEILRALVARYLDQNSTHPLGPGADINEVYIVDGRLAIVDVNSAFADTHRSGIMAEDLTLQSLALTLASNAQGLTQMKLLVDGKERATLAGHADISEPYEIGDHLRDTRLIK